MIAGTNGIVTSDMAVFLAVIDRERLFPPGTYARHDPFRREASVSPKLEQRLGTTLLNRTPPLDAGMTERTALLHEGRQHSRCDYGA